MATSAQSLVESLVEAIGDERRVSAGDSELDLHAEDLTFHRPRRPDVVVYPTSTQEVSRVLALADERGIPVTPFGAASSLEAHVIPLRGGISLDLTRMDRIVELDAESMLAVVQPGVTRNALTAAASQHGLWFPVDPGADATLGGMAATNAAGTTTLRYGKMRAQVLALEAVLPGGRVIRTGSRAPKTSAGYDLTGLLVGSEGTLAVITELTVRLHGIPEHAVAVRVSFPTVESACRAASLLVAAGAAVSRIELVDGPTMAVVNGYAGTSYPEVASLFIEAAGTAAAVDGDLELVEEVARAEGATGLAHERETEARNRLWSARHSMAYAVSAAAPGRKHRSTDVCVPVAQLAESVELARAEVEQAGLIASLVAHAGDGNYHVGFMLDPDDRDELDAAERISELLIEDALRRGGTCTGEHGIGAGKIHALEREHGDLIPLMRGIKDLFDPNGIMNPGKILRGS